jgi:PAS domain S-box-containing protein
VTQVGHGADALSEPEHVLVIPHGRTTLTSQLEQLFDSLYEGVIVLDSGQCLLYSNPAFSELVGYNGQHFVGERYPFPWCIDRDAEECETRFRFLESQRARRLGINVFAWGVRHASGEYQPVWVNRQTIVDRRRVKVGSAIHFIDRTAKARVREAGSSEDRARLEVLEASLQRIALALEELGIANGLAPPLRPLSSPPELGSLSPREWEVLKPLLEGRRVPNIARMLHISPHTVRNHLQSIFRKVGVGSQPELIDKLLSPRSSSAADPSGNQRAWPIAH